MSRNLERVSSLELLYIIVRGSTRAGSPVRARHNADGDRTVWAGGRHECPRRLFFCVCAARFFACMSLLFTLYM